MKTINITFSKQAIKSLNKLDNNLKLNLLKSIKNIPFGDIKNLKGYNNIKRLRVGKYRVIFTLYNNNINIIDIGSRGDIYK